MKKVSDNILSRVYILFGLFLFFGLMILLRIFALQINSDKWAEKANETHIEFKKLVADRGNILAEDGTIMATSIPFYKVALDPSIIDSTKWENFGDSLRLLSMKMAAYYTNPEEDSMAHIRIYEKVMEAMAKGDRHVYLTRKKINFQELQAVRQWPILRRGRWEAGLVVEPFQNERFYPFGDLARVTLGKLIDDTVGVRGIEHSFNRELRGKDGFMLAQKVAGQTLVPLDEYGEVSAIDGHDIRTTLDVDLQDVVEAALRDGVEWNYAKAGTAILLDVKTGKIKALANYPETYNHAIATRLEPGSTFKIASATALIEDGLVDYCDTINTGDGKIMFDDKEVTDNGHVYGEITFEKAIAVSSNVAVSKHTSEVYKENPEQYMAHLKDFGFYQPANNQIKGEPNPRIIEPGDADWNIATLPSMSYGYSIGVTALQMAAFYNGIANGGRLMRPYLIREITDNSRIITQYGPEVMNPQMCSRETAVLVRELMKGVVNDPQGTAYRQFRKMPFQVAGKTGTARKILNGKYVRQYRASFGGFFPANNPRYTLYIMVDEPKGSYASGGQVAGPIFRRIAEQIYRMDVDLNPPVEEEEKEITQPRERRMFASSAKKVFSDLKIPYRAMEEGDWVITRKDSGKYVFELIEQEENRIPDVRGMTTRDALHILENMGVRVVVKGIGRVRQQSLQPGYRFEEGASITLFLS